MPLSPDTLIAAGGIAPAAAGAEATDLLDAVAFAHPAVPGRVLVRLVPENLDVGVVTELRLAGFAEQARTPAVGRQRRRAPGFPGWALVNDPANARYALAVMKDFAAARKRIATKPGHARDAFQELADKLGRAAPHFLPSFWEEAGRAFVAGGAVAMAAVAFEKARGAERQHGLEVDEDARADSFVEFAIAGALSVKSLLAWPAELKKSRGPDAAFTRLFDLALRRTLGGRAPWAALPKDLRDYARAARRDPVAEEARFVRAVLGAAALKRAPIGFWKEAAASVEAAATDLATARALAKLFPELSNDEEIASWIGLLDRWGVLSRLASVGIDGGLATWMAKALEAWDDAPAALLGIANRLAPRLAREGAPVRVMGEDVWRVNALDAYDALVAAGVPLQVVDANTTFALDTWAEADGDHPDPVHLAADPVLAPILRASVLANLDEEAFQAIAPGLGAFREVRREHLVGTLARFATGGLVALDAAIGELESKVPASTRLEFPAEAEPLGTVDVVGALARTLAGGVLDELGWPAFDEAVAELRGPKQDGDVEVYTLAPWVVLTEGRRARVLGPGGREAALDLKLPGNATPAGFRWAGGQLLVCWHDPADHRVRKGYWSGKPKEILTLGWEGRGTEFITPPRDGGVLCGRRILCVGHTVVDRAASFSDAEGVWAEEQGVLHAVDPETGTLGGADAPAFLADRDGVSADLHQSCYHPQVVPGSPLLPEGGASTYGWAVFDLSEHEGADAWIAKHTPRALRIPGEEAPTHVGISLDGRVVIHGSAPRAIVRWPGSDTPHVLIDAGWRTYTLVGADGTTLADLEEDAFHGGTPMSLPLPLWHHLRPRDRAGSTALRGVGEATAARLLEQAAALATADDAPATMARHVTELLPITDPALARGVGAVVLHARSLQVRLEDVRKGAAAEATPFDGPTDEALQGALSGLAGRWGSEDASACAAIATASAFLDGGDTPVHVSGLEWRDWLAWPLAIGFVAVSPATSPEERGVLTTLLRTLAASRFARPGAVRRLTVRAPKTAGWLKWEEQWGDRDLAEDWTHVDGATRVLCHTVDGDDDDHVVVDLLLTAHEGHAVLPAGAVVTEEASIAVDADAIARVLEAAAALPVGDAVYADIAARTGLGRAEAACVWAGLRELDRWASDPLGKPARELFGLKLAETKGARDTLAGLGTAQRGRALHAAMNGWDPAHPATLPARLGDAWAATFGRRAPVDEALVTRARQDFPGGEGPQALVALAGLAGAEEWHRDAAWEIDGDGDVARVGETDTTAFSDDSLTRGVAALFWVYANTRADDPLRANLPALYAALTARVANPRLLLAAASGGGKAFLGWFKRFDGAAFLPAGLDPETPERDRPRGKAREGIYAVSDGDSVGVAIRPCELTGASREEVGRLVALEENWTDGGAWRPLELLRSPGAAAIVADRSGGWPQDPRASVSDLVPQVAAKLGLDADAAVLYLQLLTLPNPTKANVLEWNGWKPAVYTRATAMLVEKQLVVEAKRARAGRDHFLPGGWHERRTGSLPLEEWKLRWYGGDDPPLPGIVPLAPFHQLFREAWARLSGGDAPRYEKRR